jgi:hypothetical protein
VEGQEHRVRMELTEHQVLLVQTEVLVALVHLAQME